MPVFLYDDEEWESLIEADPGWSRAETDYLLDLCRRFDLRFLVIADRYQVRGRERGLGFRHQGFLGIAVRYQVRGREMGLGFKRQGFLVIADRYQVRGREREGFRGSSFLGIANLCQVRER